MITGIIFIIVGILIVAFPQLLSIIVATLLIMIGATIASVSYHFKKINKEFGNPFMDFFIKF